MYAGIDQLDDREIGEWISPDHVLLTVSAVGETYIHSRRSVHDMAIRNDGVRWKKDDAATRFQLM